MCRLRTRLAARSHVRGQCLLTAGALISKKDTWGSKDWEYWYARWHGYHDPRPDDGTIVRSDSKDWDDEDEHNPIEVVFTLGVPLPTVTNGEELKRFLEPLLQEIAPYRKNKGVAP